MSRSSTSGRTRTSGAAAEDGTEAAAAADSLAAAPAAPAGVAVLGASGILLLRSLAGAAACEAAPVTGGAVTAPGGGPESCIHVWELSSASAASATHSHRRGLKRGRLLVMRMCAEPRRGRRWHGVESARVPRVAARKAREREPAALHDAEAQHRLQRVLRAGGIKTARRPQQRTDGPLIQADQEGCDVAHCSPTFSHRAARLSRSAWPVASRARGRILTTRSTAGISRWCRRNDSRMMRRMRLTENAPPPPRTATASPRRGAPDWLTLAVP